MEQGDCGGHGQPERGHHQEGGRHGQQLQGEERRSGRVRLEAGVARVRGVEGDEGAQPREELPEEDGGEGVLRRHRSAGDAPAQAKAGATAQEAPVVGPYSTRD